MPKKAGLIPAIVIALLGFLLRVNLAAKGPIEYDEPVYICAAIQYANALHQGDPQKIIDSTYNYEHPVLNKLVYALGLLLFKPIPADTDFPLHVPLSELPNYYKLLSLRLIADAAGTFTVLILSLINPAAGLFLAVHTFAIKYSSVIYLEAVPLLLGLVGFTGNQKAFGRPETSRWPKAGSGLC